MALNGHADPSDACPLSGVERTQVGHDRMSASDPFRKSRRVLPQSLEGLAIDLSSSLR
jgi:hypothetical protein